jgi:hypothetical protein
MTEHIKNRFASISLTAFLLIFLLFPALNCFAANTGFQADEHPAPESAKEIKSQFGPAIEEKKRSFFPTFREKMKSLPPFWRDTSLLLHFRTYYFYRDIEPAIKSEAWALGGWIDYKSGLWKNRLQIGLVGYTSQKLYGPEDRAGTLLLEPGQQSFSVLGQAYLDLRIIDGMSLRLYRQTFSMPYLNKQDSRMVPNTFEAYALKWFGVQNTNTDLIIAHVTKMKTRNSSTFECMSEITGNDDTCEGLTTAGARYTFSQGSEIGAFNLYSWDLWNTFYAEAYGTWEPTAKTDIRLSLQLTDQRSVGDELDGEFDTYLFGGKAAASYQGGILSFAFSTTGSGSRILNPYGSSPGYLSLMLRDFSRADEDAWLVGLSYSFSKLGFGGLSMFTNYARGNTPDSGENASPDQEEIDLTVDYRFKRDFLKGLWLRVRGAYLNQDGPEGNDVKQFRAIINYELPVL